MPTGQTSASATLTFADGRASRPILTPGKEPKRAAAVFWLECSDESQNLRNMEGTHYRAIHEYIKKNESKCILLSATPYNKTYLDSMGALGVLNSNLFFWFITIFSDCRHVNKREVDHFPIDLNRLAKGPLFPSINAITKNLMHDLKKSSDNKVMRFAHDKLTVQCIYPKRSKPIIDEIDRVLAKHYDFTDEELDFIINYDIKYRMGGNLNGEDVE